MVSVEAGTQQLLPSTQATATATVAPPATDVAVPTITTERAFRNYTALLPQLRTTLSDVGLTLPWPNCPPPRTEPTPIASDEASSAPNFKSMVKELSRLSVQGSTLVQEQQAYTMRKHTYGEANEEPSLRSAREVLARTSAQPVPERSPPRRARHASPSPGVFVAVVVLLIC